MDERRDLYLTSLYPTPSKRLIAENVSEHEAWDAMREFWDKHDIGVYYIRSWDPVEGVHRRYDFGSHTQFFDWVKGDKNE